MLKQKKTIKLLLFPNDTFYLNTNINLFEYDNNILLKRLYLKIFFKLLILRGSRSRHNTFNVSSGHFQKRHLLYKPIKT